jgi:hypothetical protein
MNQSPPSDLLRPRWAGTRSRLEVWYTTITDPASGTGFWLHHELCAPAGGGAAAAYGWIAVFPPDDRPRLARFGPVSWQPPEGDVWFAADGASYSGAVLRGNASGPLRPGDAGEPAEILWDLTAAGGGRPLYAMPRWAWRRPLLPAAHVVPAPVAAFTGEVTVAGQTLSLRAAPGGTARIFGHGNARRWGWLHADLGDGEVLEIVAAVSTRPGLRRWRPLPFVRLRYRDDSGALIDWPTGDQLLAAFRFRADLDLPVWAVRGQIGDRRLDVTVRQPPDRTVSVAYADPDGAKAVCHNSELATVTVELVRRNRSGWAPERQWRLDGTGHAEIGLR